MPATRDSIKDIWGPRTPHGADVEWPVRVDERVDEPPDRWVQAGCVLCSNGCGCDIAVKGNRIVGVRGRADDVVNKGRLGFVVVQDAFLTETARLADVVLPAAIWGEKTGCSTNVSRVVHLHHKAVEPPGEARSDLDIFLDFARRMDFRDKDGAPLIKWSDAEGAFNAWRECTRGRPCDDTGLSYAKLTGGSGIPWPCDEAHPDGSVRLYTDLKFATQAEYCESYGQDLDTGAPLGEQKFRGPRAGRQRDDPVRLGPLSKQPHFKHSAVRVERVAVPSTVQPDEDALVLGQPDAAEVRMAAAAPAPATHLPDWLGLLENEDLLARAFEQARETHANTPDMPGECTLMAGWSRQAVAALKPFVKRYGSRHEGEPERLERALLVQRGQTAFDLLRDLQDLFLLANESLVSSAILHQAAMALRDDAFQQALADIRSHNERQREWLFGRCRQAAPQTLTVPS